MKHCLLSLFIPLSLSVDTATAGGFRLVPSEPLASSATVYEAEGRNGILIRQKLRFGPYFTTQVKRGWITRWGGATGIPQVFVPEQSRGKHAINFTLTDGADTVFAQTKSRVKSDDIIVGANRNAPHNIALEIAALGTSRQANIFSAFFASSAGGPAWGLFLDNTAAQIHRSEGVGYFESSEGHRYTLMPVWRLMSRRGKVSSMPFGSAGIEFVGSDGRACAAVSLMNGGEVHLNPSLNAEEKLFLSAACTALLLQTNLD